MTGRRAIVGLCMLCALAFSAFAAQSASAVTKGTQVFTCKEPVPGDITIGPAFTTNSHCKESDKNAAGKFRHVEVPEKTTTEITGTTEDTAGEPTSTSLHSVVSGVEVEITSPLAHVLYENAAKEKSWVTNLKDAATGTDHLHGEATVTYTAPVIKKPAGKGCKVKGEDITTNRLKFTSLGQGDAIRFDPVAAAGGVFASFEVEGCSIVALNGKYDVKGFISGTPDGATLNFTSTATTAQGTLTLRGQKAGFESSVTLKGTDKAKGDVTDTALSVTTVETP